MVVCFLPIYFTFFPPFLLLLMINASLLNIDNPTYPSHALFFFSFFSFYFSLFSSYTHCTAKAAGLDSKKWLLSRNFE